jgi:hypothetical protein
MEVPDLLTDDIRATFRSPSVLLLDEAVGKSRL